MTESILVERGVGERDDIALVTLNRPERMNAFDLAMWDRLAAVMAEIGKDERLRCVVLAAAGRAFSAGADIDEFETLRGNAAAAKAYSDHVTAACHALSRLPQPVVAALHGSCIGGGLALATACDLRIASRTTCFGVPVNRLGFTMPAEEIIALSKIVGSAAALALLLEGSIMGAEDALRIGFVTRVAADDVRTEALATAARIADGAPLANRFYKRFLRRLGSSTPLSAAEMDESFACCDSKDYRIGLAAFRARKKPVFTGR